MRLENIMSSTISESLPITGQGIPDFRTSPWGEDFSYHYYFGLVDLLKQDRQLLTFSEAATVIDQPEALIALLRHDIDADPYAALELAHKEAERGITASYFVIPNTEAYTLSDTNVIGALRRINHEYGHEVGLHYNPNQWRREHVTDVKDLEDDIVAQAKELEQALGIPIRSTTFHEPGADHPSWLGGALRLGGLANGYAGVFFSNSESALYATDSAGRWSFGEPKPRIEQAIAANARVIQLLTHAEWWHD